MATTLDFEPRTLWGHFATLSTIPRPSKREQRAVEWVVALGPQIGAEVRRDATGNVVLVVPATKGRERAPIVVLQSHLDMVCEKNSGVSHDFDRDPIRLRTDGDWLRATDTTLGADNGIGVAASLAAATDPSVVHGPLELLFTVDEETGLTGAANLDASIVQGRILLNMDSEEDGAIYVGCAGGCDTVLRLRPKGRAPSAGFAPLRLTARGLRGGHSGGDIHEGRGNALKVVARILYAAAEAGIGFELAEISGGSKHNAIPREAFADLHLANADRAKLDGIIACMREGFATELKGIDGGLELTLDETAAAPRVLDAAQREVLLRLLVALPHGVLAMSRAIPGLVETSNNLAVVAFEDGGIRVVTSSRSSLAPSLRGVLDGIGAVGRLAGAEMENINGYPGWTPNLDSKALQVVRGVYATRWNKEPEVKAIHAGLECGLLGERLPGCDMVSFGPQIEGAHSPDERVNVPSVVRFWDALKEILDRLSA